MLQPTTKNVKDRYIIFFLFFLVCLFFYKIFLHPSEILFPAYDTRMYTAWKSFTVDSFHKFHELPLWNPYYFGGEPFVGSGQSAMYYPLNLLYLLIPSKIAFGYMFFIDFLLISLFTYFFARTIKLDKYSSLISAVTMAFSGQIVLLLLPGHIFIMDGITWFPLLLTFVEKGFQKRKYIYGFLAGIVIGIIFLTGNTQIAQYSLLAIIFYSILRYITEFKASINKVQILRVISFLLITLFIGILFASIQLFPSTEFSHFSTRKDGLSFDFATDFSLHPKQLLSFILPHFFGNPIDGSYWGKGNFWSLSGYMGIISLFLASITIFFKKNKYIPIFLFLLLFSLFFAFGNYSFLFPFFYKYVPTFNFFRASTRFLFIYSFSFAALSGIAVNGLLKNNKDKLFLKRIKPFFIISIIMSIFFSLLFSFLRAGNIGVGLFEKIILKNTYTQGTNHLILFKYITSDLFLFSFFTLFFCLFVYFVMFKKKYIFHAKVILLFLIFLDLFTFGNIFYTTKKESVYYTTPKELKYVNQDNSRFRIFDLTGNILHLSSLNNIESLTGFDPLYLANYRDFLWKVGPHENTPYESFIQIDKIKNYNILRLLNVKYIFSAKEITNNNVRKVYGNSIKVYKLTNYLPRAFFIADTDKKILHMNPENLHESFFSRIIKTNSSPQIKILSYQPNKLLLATNTKQNGAVVLSENWYPGWNVYVNGKRTELLKVFSQFRGVLIKSGNNTILFEYDPFSLKIGKLLSFITLIFLCIIFGYTYRKHLKRIFFLMSR